MNKRLKSQFPTQPWKWRSDWLKGEIRSSQNTQLFIWAILAVGWNSFSLAWVFKFSMERASESHSDLALFLWSFIGLIPIFFLIREIMKWIKFGWGIFRMNPNPGVIGGKVSGTIYTRADLSAVPFVRLHLNCVKKVRRSIRGMEGRTSLWHEEIVLEKSELLQDAGGMMIPVNIYVPSNCMPTDQSDPRKTIRWYLSVESEMAGIDYTDIFEVPVFRPEQGAGKICPPPENYQKFSQSFLYQPIPISQINVEAAPSGGWNIVYPAARNWIGGLFTSLVFLIFVSFSCVLALVPLDHGDSTVEIIFSFFLFFEIMLLTSIVPNWLLITRVVVDRDSIKIRRGLLGIGFQKTFLSSQVKAITLKPQAVFEGQQYGVSLILENGHRVPAGDGIRNKREADWIIGQMRKTLGQDPALDSTEFSIGFIIKQLVRGVVIFFGLIVVSLIIGPHVRKKLNGWMSDSQVIQKLPIESTRRYLQGILK